MEAKREEFRKYLEKQGVLEFLTKQLVRLHDEAEKPPNAIEYLKSHFIRSVAEVEELTMKNLEKENQELKENIQTLQSDKADLELKFKQLQYASTAEASSSNVSPIVSLEQNLEGNKAMETPEDKTKLQTSALIGSTSPQPIISAPNIPTWLLFDLETSGGIKNRDECEILQIAIVDMDFPEKCWQQYLKPSRSIDPGATNVNHLTFKNDILYYKGVACDDVVTASEGIRRFMEYLTLNYPHGVVLIAHYGFGFDFPILRRYLKNYYDTYSIKCIDSINIFKKHFPNLVSYSQPNLLTRFIQDKTLLQQEHEALGDCTNLKLLIELGAAKVNMTTPEFIRSDPKILWSFD